MALQLFRTITIRIIVSRNERAGKAGEASEAGEAGEVGHIVGPQTDGSMALLTTSCETYK